MGIFDKLSEKEVWASVYNKHTIQVINKGKLTLFIDGKEADKQKGLINVNCTLKGRIPETDEFVIFVFEGDDDAEGQVSMFIGKEQSFIHGAVGADGNFSTLDRHDKEKVIDGENEALVMSGVLSLLDKLS